MKFVVFNDEHHLKNERHLGLIDDRRVLNLSQAIKAYGEKQNTDVSRHGDVFSSLLSLIESGPAGLELAREAIEKLRASDQPGLFTDLAEAKLHAPWPGQRLVMTGINFADHVANFFTHFGSPIDPPGVVTKLRAGNPQGFWATARPVMGPEDDIQIPGRAKGLFDYEAEPGIILGKRGKDIKTKDFKDYIWGVTLLVDWSVREEAWPPKPADSFLFSKNFDCSKSIGPCVVVDEVDAGEISLQTLVNGVVKQDFNSRDMIFSFAEIIEYLSEDFTFHPGDVVSGGTAAGTAVDRMVPLADGTWPRDLYLKPGDIVEIRSPQIGSFKSRIIEKRQ